MDAASGARPERRERKPQRPDWKKTVWTRREFHDKMQKAIQIMAGKTAKPEIRREKGGLWASGKGGTGCGMKEKKR